MSRPLHLEQPLEGSVAQAARALRLPPATWLPEPLEHDGGPRFHVYLWAGQVGLLIDATIAAPRRDRGTLRRLVRLDPDRRSFLGRWAPAFVGDIVLSERDGVAVVALDGTYQPPFGLLGDLGDVVGLRLLARRTATRFLSEVVAGLQRAAAARGQTVDA